MSDEIELLARYRADAPEPSPQVWEHARLAVSRASALRPPPRTRDAWHQRRWVRVLAPAAASAAAVLAVVTMLAVRLPVHQHRAAPTGWQPARPVPVTSAGGRHGPGWRLDSYLNTRIAPLDKTLTCLVSGVCYAEGRDRAGDVLFTTPDGAVSWGVISAPAGMRFTTALSCWSGRACAAGVAVVGRPAEAVTADGGHSWRYRGLPAKAGWLFTLMCPQAGTCYGLASTSRPGGLASPVNASFVTITGTQVTDGRIPAGQMESLSCPVVRRCVALGMDGSSGDAPLPGVVEVTADGGATWSEGDLPRDYDEAPELSSLECPDGTHCWATGMYSMLGYAILASADGGRTWHYRRQVTANSHLPVGDALACSSASACQLAGGWPDWGQKIGDTTYDYTAMLATGDAGAHWRTTTLGVPAHIPPGGDPGSYGVLSIQCPAVTFCVGLGSLQAGSTAEPVYTFGHRGARLGAGPARWPGTP